jgi:hypothetical protein
MCVPFRLVSHLVKLDSHTECALQSGGPAPSGSCSCLVLRSGLHLGAKWVYPARQAGSLTGALLLLQVYYAFMCYPKAQLFYLVSTTILGE